MSATDERHVVIDELERTADERSALIEELHETTTARLRAPEDAQAGTPS